MHSSRMRTGRSLTVCCSLLPGGVCLVPGGGGGFSLPGGSGPRGRGSGPRGGLPGPEGGCLPGPGGVLLGPGGVVLPAGGVWSQGVLPVGGVLQRPPPVYRITDTCKNITLATTSLRPVIMSTVHLNGENYWWQRVLWVKCSPPFKK